MNASGENLDLILDTHTLSWMVTGHPRLSKSLVATLDDPDNRLFVSAVTAYEYSDLVVRGRLPSTIEIDLLQFELGFILLDYPAELWREAASLPNIHGDPVDRMLVAHAVAADLTVVTADTNIHRYPVKFLW